VAPLLPWDGYRHPAHRSGALASALVGYEGRLGHGEWLIGQPDMDEKTDEDESHHEELV
jgi:hypothetical protein